MTGRPPADDWSADLGVLTAAGAWKQYRHDLERRRKSKRTIRAYRYAINDRWFRWLDDRGRRWDRVTRRDFEQFLNSDTRRPGPRGRKLSANTQLHYAVAVRGLYRWAYQDGHTRTDRLAGVVLPRGGRTIPRGVAADALETLFRAIDAEPYEERQRLLVCAMLAYGCGLRVAEIAAARVEDVLLYDDEPVIIVPRGKGDYPRVVALATPVRAVLGAYLVGRPAAGPLVESLRRPGQHITPQRVSRILSTTMHAAGIRESAHALRHTFAKTLRAEGVDVATIAKLLGHAHSGVTERVYLLGFHGDGAKAVELLPDPRGPRTRRVK
jgi:site-specific recombinase XerD